ncbi:UNVERIFIED_CONTAM: hypothetical protein PYX00_002827 [Menopon gallinae]|uniref:Gustatory receptor n=1 Tax=Menopon gallinae TaxID=328185 RepID=A0AAW2HXY4_9NEOP
MSICIWRRTMTEDEDRARRRRGNLTRATCISDVFGLSSFYTPHSSQKFYRFAVFVAIVATHITLHRTMSSSSDISMIFFRIRLWLTFLAAVLIFFVQAVRGEAVKNCHGSLPPLDPFPRFLTRFVTFFTLFIIYQVFYIPLFITNMFYILILMFYSQVPSVQFEYLIAGVRCRVRDINEHLRKFVNEGPPRFFSPSKTKGKEEELKKLHEEYLQLMELVGYLASTYSFQILIAIVILAIEILYIVQSSFFDVIRKRNTMNPILDFGFKMYAVVTLFCNMLFIVRSGQTYLDECKRTDFILCEIINTNPGVSCPIREFAVHKITYPASISILKLFNLNYEFFYNIGCGLINFGFIVAIFHLGAISENGEV